MKTTDMSSRHQLLPEPLLAAIQEQRCVLFLGAGASRAARDRKGNKCPSTEDLRKSLALRFLGSEMAGYDLMTVAEMSIQTSSGPIVFEHIRKLMEDQEPTAEHLLIPKFRWRMIAGTNYDLLVERAYAKVPDRLQTVVPFVKDSEPVIERLQAAGDAVPYIKLHGSIDDIHDLKVPPILSHEHYERFIEHRRRLFDRVYDAAHESPVVFCGYSLSDPHIRSLIYRLGAGTRPAFYLVSPKPNAVERQFWGAQNVTVVDTTFKNFMTALDNSIPPLMRAPAVRSTTIDRPIRRHFKTEAQESDRLSRAFEKDLTLIRVGLPTPEQDPKKFYEGFDTGWGGIQQRLDVRRRIEEELLFEAVFEEKSDTDPRLFIVKGPGGSGKTILLKRTAWEAANSLDQLVIWKKRDGALDPAVFQELFELSGKRMFIFIDRIALSANAVDELMSVAKSKNIPVTIIGAEREGEWHSYCDVLDVRHDPMSFPLGRLSKSEAEQLIELLERHNSLGLLAGKTREQQLERFMKFADRQLLVALHEVTRGKPFEEIIAEEYETIIPDEARRLYLDICTLNQFAVPVRAGTISRVTNIGFNDYQTELFEPLSNLVFVGQDPYTGDYNYRARHSQVARLVFQAACASDEERAEQLSRLIGGMDVGYSTDRVALSKMMRGRRLAESMQHAQAGRDLYQAAIAKAPGEAFILQQWGIFESAHEGGSLKIAEEAAQAARSMEPHSTPIIHTQAEVARKQALAATAQVAKDQYRRQARERLSEMKPANNRFAVSTRCKLLVDSVTELARSISSNSTPSERDVAKFGETVREAEALLARSLQERPDEADLLEVEARFRQALSDTDGATNALERAWRAGPRGSSVPIRLARIYASAGKDERAIRLLTEVLDQSPEDKAAHFQLALTLLGRDAPDVEQVGNHLRHSFSVGDKNFEARHLYAQWLVWTGEAQEAKKLFDQIEKTAPKDYRSKVSVKDTPVTMHMGRCHARVVKKTASFAFLQSVAFVRDIYAPEFGSNDWDEFDTGSDVTFRMCFNRSGPVAVDVQVR